MRSKGELLEAFVAAKLEPIYKYSRPTIGSGSTPVEKGDVKNPYFMIECKNWNTKSFSIRDDVWQKLRREAAHDSKDPVYVVENSAGNRLAIMDLEDWFSLVYELLDYRANENIMQNSDKTCPYCGKSNSVKFPCCGYLCMVCGKTFEEEDNPNIENKNK
jgi:tRNA(Ile2) C34 agmatinyltransferase TiaS